MKASAGLLLVLFVHSCAALSSFELSQKTIYPAKWMGGAYGSWFNQEIGVKMPHSEFDDNVFVCRGRYGDGVVPGKYLPRNKRCYITYAGKELVVHPYEILGVTFDLEWKSARNGDFPDGAIQGGVEDGWPSIVCRALVTHGDRTFWLPGKLTPKPGVKVCSVPLGGERVFSEYEVLFTRL